MADRTSAEIFGQIFELLAGDKPLDRRAFARQVWDMGLNYDFHWAQMGCNEALIKLDLARKGIDPDHPEEGETVLYGPVEESQEGQQTL